jgi:hypothetical protein
VPPVLGDESRLGRAASLVGRAISNPISGEALRQL